MPKFRSNGAELYYAVDGVGLPIVFLHCLPMDHRIWMNQFFELTSKYKVIGLDFRGLGLSQGGSNACSIANFHITKVWATKWTPCLAVLSTTFM